MGSNPIITFLVIFTFFIFIKTFNFKFFFVRIRYNFSFFIVYLDKLKLYSNFSNNNLFIFNILFYFHAISAIFFLNDITIGNFAFNSNKQKSILICTNNSYFVYFQFFLILSNYKIKIFNFYNKYLFIFLLLRKRWLSGRRRRSVKPFLKSTLVRIQSSTPRMGRSYSCKRKRFNKSKKVTRKKFC